MAGQRINIEAGTLRNSALEILGAGLGSYTKEEFKQLTSEFLPEIFQLAASGKISSATHKVPLKNIEKAWQEGTEAGKRLVITVP